MQHVARILHECDRQRMLLPVEFALYRYLLSTGAGHDDVLVIT